MPSAMARETAEAPAAVARLLDAEWGNLLALGRRLATLAPRVVVTCARGSSDHASLYLKYALEIATGLPVASMGPSIASVYATAPRLAGAAVVTISQSGRSPDLVAFQHAARQSGALTIALVNDAESPVAQQAECVVPLHAGPETSVAATKSFVASLAAAAALVACWTQDEPRQAALRALPAALDAALRVDLSAPLARMGAAPSSFTLGRGPTLAIAAEAALKIKEVLGRHAEAYSLAEVMHGPLRLVHSGFPVLAFLAEDRAAEANREALARLEATGATVLRAGGALDPIAMILPFYRAIEATARAAGLDPDRPANLSKVTRTV